MYEEASRVTDRILLVMMPPTQKTGKEPPLPVSDIMRKNRVIIIATKDSMTHTRARAAATREGARIVSMPGIGRISFESGGMTAVSRLRFSFAPRGDGRPSPPMHSQAGPPNPYLQTAPSD